MIQNRRSVNYFDPARKSDKETIKKIIDFAVNAPSAYICNLGELLLFKATKQRKSSGISHTNSQRLKMLQ